MSIKSTNLKKLQKLGFNVPEFVVLKEIKKIPFTSDFYAVRSSAKDEDQKGTAGKHQSYLFVSSDQLFFYLTEVLSENGEAIVQKQINADMSGIIIIKTHEASVFIAEGLCEGITSGRINTCEYKFLNNSLIYQKPLFETEPQKMVFNKGLKVVKGKKPVLSEKMKQDLVILIEKIQDKKSWLIEFSFKDEELFCLQLKSMRG